jgi:hypothetical protein
VVGAIVGAEMALLVGVAEGESWCRFLPLPDDGEADPADGFVDADESCRCSVDDGLLAERDVLVKGPSSDEELFRFLPESSERSSLDASGLGVNTGAGAVDSSSRVSTCAWVGIETGTLCAKDSLPLSPVSAGALATAMAAVTTRTRRRAGRLMLGMP